ncbi:MAG TPA: HAD-IA family hydrolase [Clostridia bacterium]|nr:HAD-IA family hydrolase [Clostridia bacterium]
MLKAVIFDFDGTLTDTRDFLYDVYVRLHEKYGINKLSREEFEKMKNMPIKERLVTAGVSLFKLPVLLKEAREIYAEYINRAVPYRGIREVIRKLKNAGYYLCIVSSNTTENIKKTLSVQGLDLFDKIYTSSKLFMKNHAICHALEQIGVKNSEAVYIGDELRDVVACKRVPMKMIAVSWGYDHETLLLNGGADYLVRDPYEIIELLPQIEGV